MLPLPYRVRATPSSRLHKRYFRTHCFCPVAYSPRPTFQAASSRPPVTPRRSYYKSAPLPSSSPVMSSPSSSPVRPIVNIVSSPGPMGPEPTEDDYEDLPFKLPPGPYSHSKPDLPYAALIGQAILASPEHRLTLQEIYDFITIVYPHFKRNEQTWMNSIRHVLSTTIVFRKVQRDRAAGRTLWAIFDQDLDCFVGGGFRKEFCADMQEQREKTRHSSRKRAAEDTPTRKPKRKKLKSDASQDQIPPAMHSQMGIPMSTLPAVAYPGPPMFPGPRPGTHHQPYYTPYVMHHPHAVPAGVIFPVLPPGSVYNPVTTEPTASAPHAVSPPSTSSSAVSHIKVEPEESPSPSLPPSSSASLPELTPNNSSSSPPGETDDQGAAANSVEESARASASVSPKFDISAFLVVPEEAPLDALAPGVTLLNPNSATLISGANSKTKGRAKKGKEKAVEKYSPKVSDRWRDPVINDQILILNLCPTAKIIFPPSTRVTHVGPSECPASFGKSKTIHASAEKWASHFGQATRAGPWPPTYATSEGLRASFIRGEDTTIPSRSAHEPISQSSALQIALEPSTRHDLASSRRKQQPQSTSHHQRR